MERFLHPGREDLPDIDLDLASQVRGRLFGWLLQRYGPEHVARVGSIERWQPRSAFLAAAAAHGLATVQARAVLDELGGQIDALKDEADTQLAVPPQSWPLEPVAWQRLVAAARSLVGLPHELVKHPSGIVLSAAPVEDLVPVQRRRGRRALA